MLHNWTAVEIQRYKKVHRHSRIHTHRDPSERFIFGYFISRPKNVHMREIREESNEEEGKKGSSGITYPAKYPQRQNVGFGAKGLLWHDWHL